MDIFNEFTRALKRKVRYFQFKRTAVQIEIKIFGQIVLFPSILVGALLCSCRARNFISISSRLPLAALFHAILGPKVRLKKHQQLF